MTSSRLLLNFPFSSSASLGIPFPRSFPVPFRHSYSSQAWANIIHTSPNATENSNLNQTTMDEGLLAKKKKRNEHRHKLHICGIASPLQDSIASLIEDADKDTLRHSSLKIFDSLRSTAGRFHSTRPPPSTMSLANPNQKLLPHHVVYDEPLVLAYLTTRLPHHYVAITRVLQELYKKLPGFHPRSILDFGTGPGTAIWAIRHSLLPWAQAPVTAVDINPHMLNMAKHIAKEILRDHDQHPLFLEYLPVSTEPQFDLTVASFVFSEIEDSTIFKRSVQTLWETTKDILIVVDRGTPSGFERILQIRDSILQSGNASVIAPCPHSLDCPLKNDGRGWCHFSQKMQRTPEMLLSKNSERKGEDIRYTYMILRKGTALVPEPSCTWSRVLTVPIKRQGHVILDVCMHEGEVRRGVVSQRAGKDIYKTARKIGWGDQFPFPLSVVWHQRGLERQRQPGKQKKHDKEKDHRKVLQREEEEMEEEECLDVNKEEKRTWSHKQEGDPQGAVEGDNGGHEDVKNQ